MDVAHDTINSTQGPALIEVAYSPSSEGKGQGFFRSNSGRVSWDLCRPSESNEGRRTIRFIKGHRSRPICSVNHQRRGGTTMDETPPASILLHSPGAGRSRAAGHSGALAWRPDLAADGRAVPEFRPDQTLLCLSCSHARRPEDPTCPGLEKYVEIFVGPWRESQSIFSRIPYHATHGDLSIDR